MEKGFLNIVTLFDSAEERSVNRLSAVYEDMELLQRAIEKVISGSLNEDHIKGRKVLLKPNWVKQSKNEYDEICLRTNDAFILATLRIVLPMGPSQVVLGDAPIQGCSWKQMISGDFAQEIDKLSNEFGIPVQIKDFRRRTYDAHGNKTESEIRPLSEYLIFDMGRESLLEPITSHNHSRFRVTDYDPDRMSSAHSPGVHKYCITRDFFEAEVVISLPKVKTHQKAGITAALKNLVGINGDKDFLPHHRIGGTGQGGDCYPGRSHLRYWSELFLDKANRRQGKRSYWFWQKLSSLFWKISRPGPEHQMAAGWHGNDTTWRMVMDLNRIAKYGDAKGKLMDSPQRQVFSLCDGIVGGQGDGPLEPDPLPLGIISFTDNSLMNDRAMALLMGMPVEQIPLVNVNGLSQDLLGEIHLDGKKVRVEDLKQYAIKTIPPKGWAGYFKRFQ